jgi:hypothetical protein
MPSSSTKIEKQILKEIHSLSAEQQAIALQLLHFLRREILEQERNESIASTDRLLQLAGTWQDKRTAEQQIAFIRSRRKSIKSRAHLR